MSLVFLNRELEGVSGLQKNDVGKIIEERKNSFLVSFLRINQTEELDKRFVTIIDIHLTGDQFENKVCDRCFKYLKTQTDFENNRIKKGGLITKRPSCRNCRKQKDGKSIPYKIRKEWMEKKPKVGDIFLCPICKKQSIGGISKHVLDHNHHTGEVRGFICESCNTGIGRFDDDVSLVRNAINWLLYQKT